MILITGGARSGKSQFAENMAQQYGQKILYIATAEAFDDEMKQRILLHQQRRPSSWDTFEGYLNLDEVIENSETYDCILLDCVTILITNMMFYYGDTEVDKMDFEKLEQIILYELKKIISAAQTRKKEIIFVTNEIGLGLIPESKLGRHFRDIAGKANQIIAEVSDTVYFLISGIPMQIKGVEQ